MQQSVPTIIEAMKEANVPRLVLLSAYGVGDSARTAGLIAFLVYKTVVRAIYHDKERSEACCRVGTEVDLGLSGDLDRWPTSGSGRGTLDGSGTQGGWPAEGLARRRSVRHARCGKRRPDHWPDADREQQRVSALRMAPVVCVVPVSKTFSPNAQGADGALTNYQLAISNLPSPARTSAFSNSSQFKTLPSWVPEQSGKRLFLSAHENARSRHVFHCSFAAAHLVDL